VAADAERAQGVCARDTAVDGYYATIFRELITYMMENPRNIFVATRIQSIAKYIERIADHATNVAEMVVFMVRGKDIRHSGKLAGRRPTTPVPPEAESSRALGSVAPPSGKRSAN
jgi:phosphate transport system protein